MRMYCKHPIFGAGRGGGEEVHAEAGPGGRRNSRSQRCFPVMGRGKTDDCGRGTTTSCRLCPVSVPAGAAAGGVHIAQDSILCGGARPTEPITGRRSPTAWHILVMDRLELRSKRKPETTRVDRLQQLVGRFCKTVSLPWLTAMGQQLPGVIGYGGRLVVGGG